MELFERITVDPEVCAVTLRRRSSWSGIASRKRRSGPPLVAAGLAILLFCAAAFSVPVKALGGFPDLAGHPAEAIVAEAAEAGIVNGYPDGTFRPDTPVTRAEYIKLLVAAGRLRPGNCIGGPIFRDTGGHWLEAAGCLCTASCYGVVDENDYPEDCLKPDEPITRLEMAVMAERLLGRGYQAANEVAAPLPFLDAAGIPERATSPRTGRATTCLPAPRECGYSSAQTDP